MRGVLILFFLISCGKGAQFLKGTSREVVLAYSEDSKYSAGAIYKFLLRVFNTPQSETLFKIHPIKWGNFKNYEAYRNKVLLLLPNDSLWELCNDEEGFFVRKDIFIKGDLNFLFCSYDSRGLLKLVSDNLQILFDSLFSKAVREISNVEMLVGEDRSLKRKISEKFNFEINIPKGWNILFETREILVINKHNPDRFIMFFVGEERDLNLEDILNLRDSLTARIYQGDLVVRDYVYSFSENLGGISALKVYGIWKNDSLVVGGPFLLYAFNKDGKFYLIDVGVFAPESNDKLGLILRMEGLISQIKWK